jgi:hypothetical protein
MNFLEAISPVSIDEFVERHIGTIYLRREGPPDKFRSTVSWEALNTALNQFRAPLGSQRLRLVQDCQLVDARRYLSPKEHTQDMVLNTGGFQACLGGGATLVLDAVDELFPPVRRLAESAEDLLSVRVQANLYAGWRTQQGFDLHWDGHDTLILQVVGRKHWRVFEPTRPYPLKQEGAKEIPPQGPPIWEGVLEAGSFLYMPRGWWHVACALDEPSLHLTLGLHHPTGDQLLAWFVDELKRNALVRMDVPQLKAAANREEYRDRVRDLFLAAWSDDIVDQYAAFAKSRMPARPSVDLPGGVSRHHAALAADTQLCLSSARQLFFTMDEGDEQTSFVVDGTRWNCHPDVIPALRLLTRDRPCSVEQLCAAVPPQLCARLRILLTALGATGSLVPSDRPLSTATELGSLESKP